MLKIGGAVVGSYGGGSGLVVGIKEVDESGEVVGITEEDSSLGVSEVVGSMWCNVNVSLLVLLLDLRALQFRYESVTLSFIKQKDKKSSPIISRPPVVIPAIKNAFDVTGVLSSSCVIIMVIL